MKRQMAYPDREYPELDLTAWEWLKVICGTVIVFVVGFALLLLLSFAG